MDDASRRIVVTSHIYVHGVAAAAGCCSGGGGGDALVGLAALVMLRRSRNPRQDRARRRR